MSKNKGYIIETILSSSKEYGSGSVGGQIVLKQAPFSLRPYIARFRKSCVPYLVGSRTALDLRLKNCGKTLTSSCQGVTSTDASFWITSSYNWADGSLVEGTYKYTDYPSARTFHTGGVEGFQSSSAPFSAVSQSVWSYWVKRQFVETIDAVDFYASAPWWSQLNTSSVAMIADSTYGMFVDTPFSLGGYNSYENTANGQISMVFSAARPKDLAGNVTGSYYSIVSSSGYPLTGTCWYHVGCSYDGTQATNSDRCKLFINGQEEDTAKSGDIPPYLAFASGSDMYFNLFAFGYNGYSGYWRVFQSVSGAMDNASIFLHATASAADFLEMYQNCTLDPRNHSNTQLASKATGWWTFGTTVASDYPNVVDQIGSVDGVFISGSTTMISGNVPCKYISK